MVFQATRFAALARLKQFLPLAGQAYACSRNHVFPDHHNVSCLSPWLRHRLISEQEVVEAVLQTHSFAQAQSFIEEVLWRSYWKGWLQMRPQVWEDYCFERDQLRLNITDDLRHQLIVAELGHTHLDCFNQWINELKQTGYLHNHVRLWFASIWIFTLKLPWQLGADLFMRYLLDGDAASNTLSWRWVAGLHTEGKHYLATAENIAKLTQGKFNPVALLNETAASLPFDQHYQLQPLPSVSSLELAATQARVLLVLEDDLDCVQLLEDLPRVQQVILLKTARERSTGLVSRLVCEFAEQAIEHAAYLMMSRIGCATNIMDMEAFELWLDDHIQDDFVLLSPQVGAARDAIQPSLARLKRDAHSLHFVQKPWDQTFYPQASAGYFPFKKQLPKLLSDLGVLREPS